jgi:hypothetical protein
MVLSPARLRWREPAAITDPSSCQRGRYKITNPQLSKENLLEIEIIGHGSLMGA